MTSLIAHLVAVLLLALLTYGAGGLGEQDSLLSASWNSEPEPFAAIVPVEPVTSVPNLATDLTSELAATASSPIHVVTTEPTVEAMDASTSSDRDRTLLNPMTEAIDQIRSASVQAATKEAFSMTSVASRQGANRKINVQKRGGNEASEKAVEAALKWLARHQNADGGWNLHLDAPCDGKCTHGSIHSDPQRAAATGLAILCFLGAGYTHQDGPYQKVVHDGLYYLLQIAKTDKRGAHFHQPIAQFSMYEHGIATLALCEAYQMTNDESLRKCAEDAMYFIFSAQHTDGGWGYDPKTPGDLSIACWQMMAVKSALASKIRVQMDSIKVFDRFLDSQQSDGGAMYGYRSTKPRPSTTAMGLLMRMYRGWPKTDGRILRGAEYASRSGPSPNDVYMNYYVTQMLFHLEGPLWEKWNPAMRDQLIREQSQTGHEEGSWYFDQPLNQIGGRLYTTALSCMTLEVYYRHMPIYSKIKTEAFEL